MQRRVAVVDGERRVGRLHDGGHVRLLGAGGSSDLVARRPMRYERPAISDRWRPVGAGPARQRPRPDGPVGPQPGRQPSMAASTGVAASSAASAFGLHAHQEAARAAVDVDGGEVEHAPLHVDGQGLAGAERAGPAHQVAGVALGHLGPAGRDGLAAELPGQGLHRHLAVAVLQHDQRRPGLVLHHQRLHHGVLVDAQLARAHGRAAALLVAVEVLGVGQPPLAQQPRGRRRRSLAHGWPAPAGGRRGARPSPRAARPPASPCGRSPPPARG